MPGLWSSDIKWHQMISSTIWSQISIDIPVYNLICIMQCVEPECSRRLSQLASGNMVGRNCENRRGHHGLLLRIVIIIFYSCCFVVMSFLLSMLLLYMGGFYIFFTISSSSTYWYHLSLLNYKLHFTIHVAMIHHLVGGLEHFLLFHMLEIIIPTDWYFQRGRSTTNQSWLIQRYHTIG